jgi:hypothetical protein
MRKIALIALALSLFSILAFSLSLPFTYDIRPGEGVTLQKKLSDYLEVLRDTPGDTPVFVMDSGKEGANVLILGGTHANEISGIMAAIFFIEVAKIETGKLFVIPFANGSAITWRDDVNPEIPGWFEFESATGKRILPYGSRRTNPLHQTEPDPEYFYLANGVPLEGSEARNLNRVHPGDPKGTLTQKISAGITQLIFDENIDMVHDFHESGTKSRLAYMIVCNPKNIDMGAFAIIDMQMQGVDLKLEESSDEFLGLSHKEFGDKTPALAFLSETPNPGQDTDRVDVPDAVNDPEYPLFHRVSLQILIFETLCAYLPDYTGKSIVISNIPSYEVLKTQALYQYYR